ncbi:MAG TPA: adenylate/guanylate cyclase domain-containing protein [Acidimicrobiia bacterium]|nr:adenylate/guanylate cyclase domain-containing protein [Acidimicrobiia bacterium]
MPELPTGIVTFLFTDIEGSTRLLQRLGDDYTGVLGIHSRILREAIAEAGGTVVSTEGDSFFAVFVEPRSALQAAVEAQRQLASEPWAEQAVVRVRMGVHTGAGTRGGDNYAGLDVHRAARISATGHGGQIVVSQATALLVGSSLPPGVTLRQLGNFHLKDIEQTEPLYQLVIAGLQENFPPLRTLDTVPNNLPVQLTSFVGRREVEGVAAALASSRLLTLTGPGGTGKTRLSLQVAAELTGSFADGVWFVPLAAITDPDLVTPTVTSILGLQPSNEEPDRRLTEYLKGKEILMVLDNLEQVLGAGERIKIWLQGAPGLKILASSRIPLRISGEQEYPVPPLLLPDRDVITTPEALANYESVALFVDRARASRPDFELTVENADQVAAVVSRLDGLPLAIELAAARIKVLTPAAILERLGSRLSLLTGGARDLPERQRTLRGAIEWSYGLLDADHQKLFNCLGVFAGSYALTQCEAICGPDVALDVLDGVATLADHSLVKIVSSSDEPRFTMLETIRELAQEHLSSAPVDNELRSRHASVYAALVQEGARHFTRSDSRRWLDRIEVDHDNVRAALNWVIGRGDADLAFSLCFALWRFWQMRGWLHEGRRLVEKALTLEGGSVAGRRDALEAAGGLAYWQADSKATLDFYAGALDLARQTDDAARLADALYNYSVPLTFYDDPESARMHAEEALNIGRNLDDRERLGTYTWGIGSVHYFSGEYEEALTRYMEAARHLEETGAVFQIGWTEYMIGTVLIRLGRTAESEPHLRRGLMIFADAGDMSAFALHVRDFAELAILQGDHEKALRLAGAAAGLQDVSETRMLDFVVNQLGSLEDSITIVGDEEAEKLIADGRAMSVPEILAMVGYHARFDL